MGEHRLIEEGGIARSFPPHRCYRILCMLARSNCGVNVGRQFLKLCPVRSIRSEEKPFLWNWRTKMIYCRVMQKIDSAISQTNSGNCTILNTSHNGCIEVCVHHTEDTSGIETALTLYMGKCRMDTGVISRETNLDLARLASQAT